MMAIPIGFLASEVKRWKWIAVLAVAGTAAAYAAHELGSGDIVELQVCAESAPAPAAWICKQSLLNFHPTPEEVRYLNGTAGAHIPASTRDEQFVRRLLKRHIAVGMNINAADERKQAKLTALHAMAMEPNPKAVALLLAFGADPGVKDLKERTAPELARELHAKEPTLAGRSVEAGRSQAAVATGSPAKAFHHVTPLRCV